MGYWTRDNYWELKSSLLSIFITTAATTLLAFGAVGVSQYLRKDKSPPVENMHRNANEMTKPPCDTAQFETKAHAKKYE
jgi:hypothetical protein